MIQEENSFYVTLFSHGSLDYYPKNTLSNFTVKLPYTIELNNNEKWYVGVSSVSYTNIKEPPVEVLLKITATYKTLEKVPGASVVSIIGNTKQFLKQTKTDDFLNTFKDVDYKILPEYSDTSKYISVPLSNDATVSIERNMEYTATDFFNLIFSQIMKNKRTESIKTFKKNLNKFNNDNQEFVCSLFEELLPSSPVHFMYFYLDILKPNIVNDGMARIVYIKPLLKNPDDKNDVIVQNIQYYPLEKYRIHEISVLIADETGNQINFEGGERSTFLKLHFLKGI